MEGLLGYIRGEWRVIAGAPASSIVLLIVGGMAGWWFASTTYSGEISALRAHLEFRGDQRDEYLRQVEDLRRQLSPEEAGALQQNLSAAPGEVTLNIGQDGESQMIGEQMKALFEGAGWDVHLSGKYSKFGVGILAENDSAKAITEAFEEIQTQGEFKFLPHDGSEPQFAPLR